MLGSLTGGYFNASNSRLETQKTRSETIDQIRQCEQELKTLRNELGKIETSINGIVSEMQKTETKNSKAKVRIYTVFQWFSKFNPFSSIPGNL